MEPSKMEDFVANAALLAAHLTDQCNKAAATQQAAAKELQASAIAVGKTIDDGKREIGEQTRGAIHDALAQEIPAATHSIGETAARLRQVADHLQQEQARLTQRARFLGWKSLGVLSVACLLLVAGSGYAARHNLQRAAQAKVDAEVLEALQQVTISAPPSGVPSIIASVQLLRDLVDAGVRPAWGPLSVEAGGGVTP